MTPFQTNKITIFLQNVLYFFAARLVNDNVDHKEDWKWAFLGFKYSKKIENVAQSEIRDDGAKLSEVLLM